MNMKSSRPKWYSVPQKQYYNEKTIYRFSTNVSF